MQYDGYIYSALKMFGNVMINWSEGSACDAFRPCNQNVDINKGIISPLSLFLSLGFTFLSERFVEGFLNLHALLVPIQKYSILKLNVAKMISFGKNHAIPRSDEKSIAHFLSV